MKRLQLPPIALVAAAILVLAPVAARTEETSVTIAGAGSFPQGAAYLGVSLSSLSAGVGLGIAGNWAVGQFHVTLTGTTSVGDARSIVIDGRATGGAPSDPGTATFTGTATVDPGDGTPPLPGVPFAALVIPGPDGTGSLTVNLGGAMLPAAAINEGYVTVQ
jgi:hypothetical protein